MFRRLSIITALCAALALPVGAGEAKGKGKGLEHAPGQHKDDAHKGGPSSEERFAKLAHDLNLTKDQLPKAKAAWDDTNKKMKAIHDDKSLSKEQVEVKAKALHNDAMKKFRALLTADQQKKLDAMHAEHQGKAKEHAKEHKEHAEKNATSSEKKKKK